MKSHIKMFKVGCVCDVVDLERPSKDGVLQSVDNFCRIVQSDSVFGYGLSQYLFSSSMNLSFGLL